MTHGVVLISWDGRLVRHCTSVMDRKNHVYGTFFAAKRSIVEHGQRTMAETMKAKKEQKAEADAALRHKSAKHRRHHQHGPREPDSINNNQTIDSLGMMSLPAIPRKKTILTK